MNREITSVREALLQEALKDVDGLIEKISQLDESLARTIEESTKEAVGRAYHSAHLTFKTMIDDQEKKLLAAGHNAASVMRTQLNTGMTQLVAVNESLERKAWQFVGIAAVLVVVGGAIGGIVAVKMLGI